MKTSSRKKIEVSKRKIYNKVIQNDSTTKRLIKITLTRKNIKIFKHGHQIRTTTTGNYNNYTSKPQTSRGQQ